MKKQKQVGVIDVGTNSVLALAISSDNTILYNDYKISQFGKDLSINKFALKPERIEYTFQLVSNFIREFNELGIKDIIVVGTSASRDAKNIDKFANRLLDNYQVTYRILTGEEEAKFTYLGALSQFTDLNQNYWMMDIGGGSTEIVSGKGNKVKTMDSLDIGSLRFYDQFQNKDILTDDEIKQLDELILDQLKSVKLDSSCDQFVGIGGTFTTAASVLMQIDDYQPELISGKIISFKDLTAIWDRLNGLENLHREIIIGMEKKRSPLILYGMRIYLKFMELHKLKKAIISDRGLRFGVAEEFLRRS